MNDRTIERMIVLFPNNHLLFVFTVGKNIHMLGGVYIFNESGLTIKV